MQFIDKMVPQFYWMDQNIQVCNKRKSFLFVFCVFFICVDKHFTQGIYTDGLERLEIFHLEKRQIILSFLS